MAVSRTLTIIKPDAFGSGKAGRIVAHLEDAGFRILASRVLKLPAEAEAGTVRKLYAESKERNAIHASDSDENAEREIAFFFPATELLQAL